MSETPVKERIPMSEEADGDVPVDRSSDAAPASTAPLVAICGVVGGAGATTLAYLVARGAARDGDRPVLVCDTGGPGAALAACAGVESPRSLARTANAIAEHKPLADGLFADDAGGLRVIATHPHLEVDADPVGLAHLLHDARQAHGLTVVDCGMPRGRIERQILDAATHVVWVVPASASGIARAPEVLELFGLGFWRAEAVVARRDGRGRDASLEALMSLADQRGAPLVLMPHVADLAEGTPDTALDGAAVTLEALSTVIRR